MSPSACATEISPHTRPQDRRSTWSTTIADIGAYAMLIVAWQSVHQMAIPTYGVLEAEDQVGHSAGDEADDQHRSPGCRALTQRSE